MGTLDYRGVKYANRDEAAVIRRAQKATWLRRYRRQQSRPFVAKATAPRDPRRFSVGVYLPAKGSIAFSLLGQVARSC